MWNLVTSSDLTWDAVSTAGAPTPFLAQAKHQTRRFGQFTIFIAEGTKPGDYHLVLVKGNVRRGEDVLCRVASECLLSTALDSAECDCREQVDLALEMINERGTGVFIYLHQEGRGHGILTKIRALANKNRGFDTFAAVEMLGLPADIRNYDDAAAIIQALELRSVCLLTNNPTKVIGLREANVLVSSIQQINVPATGVTRVHLEAKRRRGHTV